MNRLQFRIFHYFNAKRYSGGLPQVTYEKCCNYHFIVSKIVEIALNVLIIDGCWTLRSLIVLYADSYITSKHYSILLRLIIIVKWRGNGPIIKRKLHELSNIYLNWVYKIIIIINIKRKDTSAKCRISLL